MNNTLTLAEIEELKVYLKEIRDASKEGTPTEETLQKINSKYNAVIFKALNATLSTQRIEGDEKNENLTVPELLQQMIDRVESTPVTEDGQLPAIQPIIKIRPVEEIDFPLDKINRHIWSFEPDANGQYTFNFNTARRGKNTVSVYYSLDFDSLEDVSIVKTLTNYDKRVYTAIGALYKYGYTVMSLQQIYTAMGYTGHMSKTDAEKIYKSISKMYSAHIAVDNIEEINAKYKYEHFKYDGSLLPMERVTALVKGQVSEAAIRLFREPPIISLARSRKQLTTIDIKLLNTPISKTNENLAIEHYMIAEIEGIKAGRREEKMLYTTICVAANITNRQQKYRVPEKIKKLLDYWKGCGYIISYTETDSKDGVVINVETKNIEKKSK